MSDQSGNRSRTLGQQAPAVKRTRGKIWGARRRAGACRMRRMSRRDPRVRHRFGVEIDGLLVGHFSAVAGISSEGEVVEFQEGGRNAGMLKLPGQGRLGTLRLKRGFTGEPVLHRWASEGPGARRTVDVVLLDDAGAEV